MHACMHACIHAAVDGTWKVSRLHASHVRNPNCRTFEWQLGNGTAVLGSVGAPFTLASYIVEGGSSKNFTVIKRMAFAAPQVHI
jgi:Uroporphyrinogen decarboxylase (URO-D)